ncbi:helix-turn-helix domain-containing protein [Aquamicrobium sp. LC103]|uniref:winged helix-turn-helix transcriptional regulator n=1 Tax=Aquamicrobium sp. LC103 TaxID=1120658 RepID=UPI00063EAE4F|nr:helix-turn-helix domain-containing protein [Aquamicrobium sp. LC103]TKT79033.1 helix-turn-helix transcriptional regulator [Aquamicrobium sp. LC103]
MHAETKLPGLAEEPSARRPDECVVEFWLALLGHRWNALVLWHLKAGAKRNGELMKALPGISPKVLTERLDALCETDLVTRISEATFPRGVTYLLTPKGRRLVAILDQLDIWARTGRGGSDDPALTT